MTKDECLCGFDDTVTYWIRAGRSDSDETKGRNELCIHCYEHTLNRMIKDSRKERFTLDVGSSLFHEETTIEKQIMGYLGTRGYAELEQIKANIRHTPSKITRKLNALAELGFLRVMKNQSDKRRNVYILTTPIGVLL